MASSSKTPNLGLNLWIGSDSPKMADFNNDNTIIDTAIKALQDQGGGGGGETTSGVTLATGSYPGDGQEVYTLTVPNQPDFGIVFANNKPASTTVENGNTTQVNICFLGKLGRSAGCYWYDGKLELYQEAEGHSGYRMNMNQQGVTYVYAFFYIGEPGGTT